MEQFRRVLNGKGNDVVYCNVFSRFNAVDCFTNAVRQFTVNTKASRDQCFTMCFKASESGFLLRKGNMSNNFRLNLLVCFGAKFDNCF
ncbi:hypothetical protein ACP0HM_05010 [Escherichia coli]